MTEIQQILTFLLGFGIIALASDRIGFYGARARLPLISGFLITGVVAGPFVLGLMSKEAVKELAFVNQIALAIIAFAAGAELFFRELKGRLPAICTITFCLVAVTLTIGTCAFYLLSTSLPFLAGLSASARLVISLAVATILVARSPSSAIAIVKELRAKGPFTQTILGVTVIMDAVVIILFAISIEIAEAFFSDLDFSLNFVALLLFELILSVLFGVIVWKALVYVLSSKARYYQKMAATLLIGYGVFYTCGKIAFWSKQKLAVELFLEPLLICMIAGLLTSNMSKYRRVFAKLLHDIGPPVYLAFFTLTGASLGLDVLLEMWHLALIIFVVRIVAIFIGSFLGGTLAGDSAKHKRLAWMGFVTQAGVGIGLASELAHNFPGWGEQISTIIIAVIVINQLLGPPLFKLAVQAVGEARLVAAGKKILGKNKCIIFSSGGGQSMALARQLRRRGWRVKVVIPSPIGEDAGMEVSAIELARIEEISKASLERIGLATADSMVALLSDSENKKLIDLNEQFFGVKNTVVRLDERKSLEFFRERGALVLDPSTAMISVLEHFILSPAATSLILGMEKNQDVLEVEVSDPNFEGRALRDLSLPLDVLIVSVTREGHTLVSHGYTELKLGDHLTVVGPPDILGEVEAYLRI